MFGQELGFRHEGRFDLGDSLREACIFHGDQSGCMGARVILCRDYDWIGVAFSTNKNTSDNAIFSSSPLVLAMDRDSSSVAIIVEFLV